MMRCVARALLGALALLVGCSNGLEQSQRLTEPIVYDEDDRGEYYAADAPVRALFEQSSVVLIRNDYLGDAGASIASAAPAWGVRDEICPEEAFAGQPAAAFCSGVLVDWDLVLTAGHCARFLDVADFSVVFDYYYAEPFDIADGELGVRSRSIATPVAIVAEALDPPGAAPRLDYAWYRLARPVDGRYRPVPIHARPPSLEVGAPILTIGAPHGVPLKFDATGRVEDPRAGDDFFVARTDTSAGWSGGGAYDESGALVGIVARGGEDLVSTVEGCNVVNRVSPGQPAAEQFTYAHRALVALCGVEPARPLCDDGRESPRHAGPRPRIESTSAEGGCSMAGSVPSSRPSSALAWLLVAAGLSRIAQRDPRRRSKFPGP
jgi:hypothetical protein